MSEIQPPPKKGASLIEALDGLWEEAQNILLNMTVEQRVSRFLEIKQGGNIEKDMTEILHEFCGFWEESLRLFDHLTDVDREIWLQEARGRGLVEARFANTLQELHLRKIHSRPPEEIVP